MTIDVTAVNDLPTAADKTVTATEDTAFVFALADFGFSDVESGAQLQSIAVTTLSSKGTLTISGSTVGIDQSISRSDIESGKLTFTPATNANGTGYDSFKFTVNDGVADSSASSTMTIDVTAVNDLPTGADKTVTATEDTAFVFTVADFGFSDVDSGAQLQSIAVTTLSSTGTLALNDSAVTLGQSISRSDIDAGNLKFTPAANANGTGYDSFKFTVNDGSADSSVSSTMTIDVTAVNDLPTASDKTVTATEDTAFVFALADFGFSDVESGAQLQSIAVTTLSSAGTLTLNDSAVTSGQSISRSDIEAGNLKFTPATNANGTGYDSFKFTVNDGSADSSVSSTMTIDVTAVNDLPTASDKTVTATEDTAFVFALADFGFSDVDSGAQLQSIAVTTLSSKGTLALNGSTVTLGQSISRSNIEAGNLKFTPATNANGTGYDSFKFTVNDGTANSAASSTMTIDVTAVNDSPVGVTDSYTTLQNTQLTGTVGSNDLLQNDSDADPDVLAVNTTPVSNVTNGTLTLATDGSFTYSPSSTFFGNDSFTYQVTDGNGGTDTANVTISVTLKPDVFQPLSSGGYDSTGTWDQGRRAR